MKWYFLERLRCPGCGAEAENLILYPIEVIEEEEEIESIEMLRCRRYCPYLNKPASDVPLDVCRECARKRIKIGVIICGRCGRWYPIDDEIIVMLDDKFRDDNYYRKFLLKYKDKIKKDIFIKMKIPDPQKLLGKQ